MWQPAAVVARLKTKEKAEGYYKEVDLHFPSSSLSLLWATAFLLSDRNVSEGTGEEKTWQRRKRGQDRIMGRASAGPGGSAVSHPHILVATSFISEYPHTLSEDRTELYRTRCVLVSNFCMWM